MNFEKYVSKYQDIYKHYYGKEVSYAVALDGVIRLFNFTKAVSKPIPRANLVDPEQSEI
jgi:hypothetical protein